MLESAAGLFAAQGYHATGLNQLITEGGAPRGSLYFHFPGGKEQLAAEAMQLSAEQLCGVLREALYAAADAVSGVDAVLGTLIEIQTASGFRHGCPLAAVTLDAGSASEPIRQACSEGYASWERLLTEYLVSHGLTEERAESLATLLLAAMEGALLLATARRDPAPLQAVAGHLRSAVARELP
jgi:TetR/AcrR family transcriptional repressor of lmrAB and yxaGH operons